MKKIIYLCIAALVVSACQKNPDLSELSPEYLVVTSYDNTFNFTTPTKVYVPNAIQLMNSPDGTYNLWNDSYSKQITDEFANKLSAAGYTVTRNDADAGINLKLNVSFLEDISYFVDYPYWWWDPYYWDNGYFPDWYYPYPIVYSYAVGSLIAELVNPAITDDSTLPTVWYVYIGGPEYGNESKITPYILRGVDRAFAQSSYLRK